MSDAPGGPWAKLVVEPYWPTEASVAAAANGHRNRLLASNFFRDYANLLGTTHGSVLAQVSGATAEATRQIFRQAESISNGVSQRNSVKSTSYQAAVDALEGLRSDLRTIAAEADSEIEGILNSKKPLAMKVTEITAAIEKHSLYAAHKAAQRGSAMMTAVQAVLSSQGLEASVTDFATRHGLDFISAPSKTPEEIRSYVETNVTKNPANDAGLGPKTNTTSSHLAASETPPVQLDSTIQTRQSWSSERSATLVDQNVAAPTAMESAPTPPSHPTTSGLTHQALNTPPPIPELRTSDIPTLPTADTASIAPSAPSVTTPNLTPSVSGPLAPSFPTTPTSFGPQEFTDTFTRGMDMGMPFSGGTEALTRNVMDTAFQPTTAPDFSPTPSAYSPSTIPTAGHAVFDAPTPVIEAAHSPEPVGAMYAAPVAAIAPAGPIAPAAPVVPPSALPAYGADLRPPVVATPAAAPTPPMAAAPASAPVNPAAGASALSQQAVVRQQPTAVTTPAPTGLTETAVATATGATAGAVSAETTKRTRLQSLLEAVAQQEPKLKWAIGEFDDGSTVLVTDLACGWIPPHVEIPTGVGVLTPELRPNNLESLLKGADIVETWSPGQFLPDPKDVANTPMSIRARDLPDVDDLNWEIVQATNWRDGLPRLAHTLAKAGVAGTGILDTESDLLREHLNATARSVLTGYPEPNQVDVGNWQLLAAIDALIDGRKTTLNYHFAWFQALQKRGGDQ